MEVTMCLHFFRKFAKRDKEEPNDKDDATLEIFTQYNQTKHHSPDCDKTQIVQAYGLDLIKKMQSVK
jgi:hypothetical protein